jgi:hypothetical protein
VVREGQQKEGEKKGSGTRTGFGLKLTGTRTGFGLKLTGTRTGFGLKLTAVVAAVGAIGLATALQASGHKNVIESGLQRFKIEIVNETTDNFSGKVVSEKAKCIPGRIISITHNGVLIATATTDAAGNFTVNGPRPPKGDDVVATLTKKILKKNRKHRHKCTRDVVTRKA